MDWPGLLKWSLKYQDGTTVNKDLKPLDQATRKWLEEAMEHYTYNEVKRMGEIMDEMIKPETENDVENRLILLEELQDIVDSLDRARDLCVIGGMGALIHYIKVTKFDSTRMEALKVFSSSNQNFKQVQDYCAQNGAFDFVEILRNEKMDLKVREFLIAGVSSLVRGDNLENKRRFIDMNGIELFLRMAHEYEGSVRIREKTINILRDLLVYDGVLDKDSDVKYKNIVKKSLMEMDFLKMWKLFLYPLELRLMDSRIAFMECIKYLIVYARIEGVDIEKEQLYDVMSMHLKSGVREQVEEKETCESVIKLLLLQQEEQQEGQ